MKTSYTINTKRTAKKQNISNRRELSLDFEQGLTTPNNHTIKKKNYTCESNFYLYSKTMNKQNKSKNSSEILKIDHPIYKYRSPNKISKQTCKSSLDNDKSRNKIKKEKSYLPKLICSSSVCLRANSHKIIEKKDSLLFSSINYVDIDKEIQTVSKCDFITNIKCIQNKPKNEQIFLHKNVIFKSLSKVNLKFPSSIIKSQMKKYTSNFDRFSTIIIPKMY